MYLLSRGQTDSLEEIMSRNMFRHAQTEDNMVIYENEEIQIKNLITKAQADEWMRDHPTAKSIPFPQT